MAYKPLERRRVHIPPVTVDLHLQLQFTPRRAIDADDEHDDAEEWAYGVIEEALEAYGDDGHTLLELMGWRAPWDEPESRRVAG